MRISAIIAEREAKNPPITQKVNPFPGLDFMSLDETLNHLKGGKVYQILESIAKHMNYNKLPAASILCSGQLRKSSRYFVNLAIAKETVPQLENIAGLSHWVHFQSQDYPHIIVLKHAAIRA